MIGKYLATEELRYPLLMTALCLLLACGDFDKTEAKNLPEVTAAGSDWTQWRGPYRNGTSDVTGILKTWPSDGPAVLWKKSIGDGYSSIVVQDERLYISYTAGEDEILFCLNARSGKELWKFRLNRNYRESYGDGPRSTPAIDGDRVYAMGSLGYLYALNKFDGQKIWMVNIHHRFGDSNGSYERGYSSSPLIEGDLLIINGGRQPGKTVVALNKHSGDIVWTYVNGKNSYSSQVAWDILGERQIVSFIGYGVVGLNPATGEELWKFRWRTSYDLNISMPLFFPPDRILISSGYDKGAAMLRLHRESNRWRAEQVWTNRLYRNHFNSSVAHNGYIYGFDNAVLKCIRAEDGVEQWKTRGYNKGSLILADGVLIVLGEQGQLAIVEVNPHRYHEMANARVMKGKCWTAPSLANGMLYLRNSSELLCLDMVGR